MFLFFGFVRPYKGLHVLLDTWGGVVERVPDARLVVAGEFYADEDALRAQAAPLGDSVRFDAAYIPDDRVGLYFSAADAVVQPYVTATQSGVAQIAFGYGRPVITTDVGGLAETIPLPSDDVTPPVTKRNLTGRSAGPAGIGGGVGDARPKRYGRGGLPTPRPTAPPALSHGRPAHGVRAGRGLDGQSLDGQSLDGRGGPYRAVAPTSACSPRIASTSARVNTAIWSSSGPACVGSEARLSRRTTMA